MPNGPRRRGAVGPVAALKPADRVIGAHVLSRAAERLLQQGAQDTYKTDTFDVAARSAVTVRPLVVGGDQRTDRTRSKMVMRDVSIVGRCAMLVTVGDQVLVDGRRVGDPTREGVVNAVNGSLVTIQWDDGHESTFAPLAGTMRVTGRSEPSAEDHL